MQGVPSAGCPTRRYLQQSCAGQLRVEETTMGPAWNTYMRVNGVEIQASWRAPVNNKEHATPGSCMGGGGWWWRGSGNNTPVLPKRAPLHAPVAGMYTHVCVQSAKHCGST
mgnify:CR=1 FL=1